MSSKDGNWDVFIQIQCNGQTVYLAKTSRISLRTVFGQLDVAEARVLDWITAIPIKKERENEGSHS